MARLPFTPSTIFLVCALVLLIIVSISLPSFSAMDFVRVRFANSIKLDGTIDQVRFGIWSFCEYETTSGDRHCSARHHGYTVFFGSLVSNQIVTIGSSWTRGLAIHPVAAALTFITLVASFIQHSRIPLITILLTILSAFLTLIAFAVDIALLAYVRHKLGDLDGVKEDTSTGPAFWLTFVSFILLCVGGCTACFGRRKRSEWDDDSEFPLASLFKRFRR